MRGVVRRARGRRSLGTGGPRTGVTDGSARRVGRTARAPPPSPPSTPSGGRAQRERAPCSPEHGTSPPRLSGPRVLLPVPRLLLNAEVATRDSKKKNARAVMWFFGGVPTRTSRPRTPSTRASDTRRRPRESRFPSPLSAGHDVAAPRTPQLRQQRRGGGPGEGCGFRAHARGPGKPTRLRLARRALAPARGRDGDAAPHGGTHRGSSVRG